MSYKIHLTTLGCPKNTSDSENLLGILQSVGYQVTSNAKTADICIVNTCTFIQESTNQSIDILLEMGELNKKIIVTGCLAQRYKEELFNEFPQVKAIMGTGNVENIINAVHWVINNEEQKSFLQSESKGYIAKHDTPRLRLSNGVSSYIKISEGCNHSCSFCIIPSLRGVMKSREIDDIIKEAKSLESTGTQEIILIGQDTSAYGIDIYNGTRKLDILLASLAEETNIPWIRSMYAYPSELSVQMLQTISRYTNLVKYIDIPLQHSESSILKLMNRPVDAQKTVNMIREYIPEAVIRTSFIVGHPGESEKEFEHLLDFVQKNEFERVGVFQYSSEEGTQSAIMKEQLNKTIKQKRQKQILEIQKTISKKKNEKLLGISEKILVEKIISNKLYGRSFRDAPSIDGQVIITETKTDDLESYLGKFVQATYTDFSDYELFAIEQE